MQSLNLRNNRIGDEGIESIAEGLMMSFKEMLGWQADASRICYRANVSVEIVEDVLNFDVVQTVNLSCQAISSPQWHCVYQCVFGEGRLGCW